MLRVATPQDAPDLKRIHTHSVRVLCAPQYSAQQLKVWTSGTEDGFARVISTSPFSIVYEYDGAPVAFATLREDYSLWHLYVMPTYVHRGIGSTLLRAVEDHLKANKYSELNLESSLTARDFYLRHGYDVVGQKTLLFNGVEIPSIAMVKRFSK